MSHHDNASRLLHRAHAHDGGHADGSALEVNATARDRGQDEAPAEGGKGAEHTKNLGESTLATQKTKTKQSVNSLI